MRSPRAITQPTRGLGSVVSSPRAASSSARCIAERSNSENIARSLLLARARLVGRARLICRQQWQLFAAGGAGTCPFVTARGRRAHRARAAQALRSEEHTSELQSQFHLV